MRYFLLALLVFLLDQVSKRWIVKNMALMEQIPVIDQFFYITSHRNRGAAFGILQNQQWLFISITILVVLFLFIYMWRLRKKQPLTTFALGLVLGGALGNLLDRVRMGEVVDFFHFQYDVYQFPIFNIADAAIVVGVALLMVITLKTPAYDESENVSSKVSDS